MQQRDPRLMTHREIVSELASILARGYLRHVKARWFMIEGGPPKFDSFRRVAASFSRSGVEESEV